MVAEEEVDFSARGMEYSTEGFEVPALNVDSLEIFVDFLSVLLWGDSVLFCWKVGTCFLYCFSILSGSPCECCFQQPTVLQCLLLPVDIDSSKGMDSPCWGDGSCCLWLM